ncbi:MAG TPA: hypothetical protein VJ825_10250, partial [Gemmatimonadaceae bacterium]|nr:hypothetical protein [Gemmatimonadaceae bacterium]
MLPSLPRSSTRLERGSLHFAERDRIMTMQQNLKRSTLALTVATMLLLHADVRAQELGWSGAVEGSGTLLFGSTSQRLLAGLAQLGRADSTIDVSASARFGYTESVTDAGKRDVTGRSAFASLAVDLQPFMRY